MASQEKIEKLRNLYVMREMYWKKLDGILSEMQSLFREEPDYQKWLNEGGILESIPEWVHQVTGGRPYQPMPVVKAHVYRDKTKKPKTPQQQLASSAIQALMKGFK